VRTYQVDAVAVAFGVREIVAQVGAVEAARGRVCVLSAEHTSLRAQEQDARRAPCAHSLRALCVERALRYCHATQDCHAPRVSAQGRGGGARKRGQTRKRVCGQENGKRCGTSRAAALAPTASAATFWGAWAKKQACDVLPTPTHLTVSPSERTRTLSEMTSASLNEGQP